MVRVDASQPPISLDNNGYLGPINKNEVIYIDKGKKGVFPVVNRTDKYLWSETVYKRNGHVVQRDGRSYQIVGKEVRELTIFERIKNIAKGLLLCFSTDSSKYFKKTCSQILVNPVEPNKTKLPKAKSVELRNIDGAFSDFRKNLEKEDEKIKSIIIRSRIGRSLWILDKDEQEKIITSTKTKIALCHEFIKTPLTLDTGAFTNSNELNSVERFNKELKEIYKKYQSAINYYTAIEETAYNSKQPKKKDAKTWKENEKDLQEDYEQHLFKNTNEMLKDVKTLIDGLKGDLEAYSRARK